MKATRYIVVWKDGCIDHYTPERFREIVKRRDLAKCIGHWIKKLVYIKKGER